MRKTSLLLSCVLGSLFFHREANADSLTALPLNEVLAQMESTNLTPLGHGMVFGFESIESCLFGGEDLLVTVNYCYPKRNYPARSVVFWSKRFGVIELYEETLSPKITKRDVRINEFPELVQNIFSLDFGSINFETVNSVSRKLYERDNPACWVTNFDQNEEAPSADCRKADPKLFEPWIENSRKLVDLPRAWNEAFSRVSRKTGVPMRALPLPNSFN